MRGLELLYAEKNGTKTYYHYNAHGDVVVLTNASGTKTKSYTYSAFGVEYSKDVLDTNPFRYCGEYYDAVSDTIYLRARYYNAGQGRFTQEDPIRDGRNWYAYCGGNPIMRIDPTGRSIEDFMAGFGVSLDESISFGLFRGIFEFFTGSDVDNYIWEDEVDYYAGRVVGDILAMAGSIKEIIAGIKLIYTSIATGGITTVFSGGTLSVAGVSICVEGVAAGTVVAAHGASVVTLAVSNFDSDFNYFLEIYNERKAGVPKQNSTIWNNLDDVKGKSYKSSGDGKHRKYYQWDYLHNEIEVYDRNGNHLGAMDPITGEMIKPAKKGRVLKVK